MVYDWDDKRETCYRMYVVERKTLDDIMNYFKQELGFVPRLVFSGSRRNGGAFITVLQTVQVRTLQQS